MALTMVTEPAREPVDLDELEDHLRLSETSTGAEDVPLLWYLQTARRYCEKVQGRAYLEQTWRLTLGGFPRERYIVLPRPPLLGVTSVTYYGTGGTASTMTAGNYYVDTASEPGRVHLGYGELWPTTTLRPANGVEVLFSAGYGSVASSVPIEVKQAIKLMAGHLYEHREAVIPQRFGGQLQEMALGADALLWLDRVVPI